MIDRLLLCSCIFRGNCIEAISLGEGNTHAHPAQQGLGRLATVGSEIHRTDKHSTVVITSDGQMLWTSEDEALEVTAFVCLPLIYYGSAPDSRSIEITHIFYDGVVPYVESDEYAAIKNTGSSPVNLDGWRLNAGAPGQDFWFPDFTMQPRQECRVYTNEVHPEWCGFSFGGASALWSSSRDWRYLYDGLENPVVTYRYP